MKRGEEGRRPDRDQERPAAPLVRLPSWRGALFAAIAGYRRRPFAWGSSDCALFAADCVLAMTGVDLAAPFRGRYGSEAEARALLAAEGGSVVDLAAARLPEISPAKMRMGDVVAVHLSAETFSLGICNLSALMVLRLDGIGTLPASAAVRAFRVG